jgi:hypothetical protein
MKCKGKMANGEKGKIKVNNMLTKENHPATSSQRIIIGGPGGEPWP